MRKRILSAILSLSIGVSLCACSGGGTSSSKETTLDNSGTQETSLSSQPTQEETIPILPVTQSISRENSALPTADTYNILFIGNSHTYYNQMPEEIFSEIVKSAGYSNVNITSITAGGAAFSNHLTPDFSTNLTIEAYIATGQFDYVVLQERLADPITQPQSFYRNASRLVQMIQEANPDTKVVFYQVWGGTASSPKLGETGCSTTDEINCRLAAANTWIAKRVTEEYLTATVAYSGLTFLALEKANFGAQLYADDGYHPSYVGSYASALTIFSTIFGADPTSVTWNGANGQISEENALIIKNAVKDVVFNAQPIDATYSEHLPNYETEK